MHVGVQMCFSLISACGATITNKCGCHVSNHRSPHLTLSMNRNTEALSDKWPAVSPQCYCWLGSHAVEHENASFTHSVLCTAAFWMQSFSMGLILSEQRASVEHLNASWMVLDAFGRIIENQCISEQHSLAVRNIQTSFGLWNSIPQPHLNSNKQLWIYS